MKKRAFAILIAALLALTMLSGCGSTNTGGTSNAGGTGNTKVNVGGSSVETGQAWPANWPTDIPKLDGKVKSSVSTDVHSNTGLSVFLSVSDVSVVKAYADKLVSQGYKSGTVLDEGGDYAASLKGSAYSVSVTFSHDTNDASVTVTAAQ
ncbi:MAG: hypothetical protein FWF45_03055 [Coriobacteriia bacterium]|nr:hypothetical protein [Coriobacteriia bacterium]